MKKISLKALLQMYAITAISVLRTNENGYPFVTCIDQKGNATNLYFGKNSAEKMLGTFAVGAKVLSALVDAEVVDTINEAGEQRFKLSLAGQNDYSSTSELATLFGVVETVGEFDLAKFRAEFTARVEGNTTTGTGNVNKNTEVSPEDQLALLETELDAAKTKTKKNGIQAKIDALVKEHPELA